MSVQPNWYRDTWLPGYAVEAASLEDFFDRFCRYKAGDPCGDDEYRSLLLNQAKDDVARLGVWWFSSNDSSTGRLVSWFPPEIP